MSTEAALQGAGSVPVRRRRQGAAWTGNPHIRRILRFSFGLTLATAVAFAFEWPLYFLTPILTSTFLTLPLPPPTLRRGLVIIGYVVVGFAVGLGFTLFLLRYPSIYMPVLGLVLFHLYYLVNRGGPILFVLMSLLAVLILPMLGILHGALALGFTAYFVLSGVLAVVFYLMAYGFFPEPGGQPPPAPKAKKRGYAPAAAQAALKSTVAILPLAIVFIAGSWTSEVLVLVFAAIFSLSPELAKGRAAAVQSLLSTLVGGVAAILFYYLIVAVPEFYFFVILMFATTLLFGMGIYSGRPIAKYLPSAVAALIVLVASSTGEGGSVGGTFIVRVLLIGAASIYVVAVMALFERFWPQGKEGSR